MKARAEAESEVSGARSQAMGSLTDDVAQVAAGAASTVLGRQIDAGAARPIVEQALEGDES